MNKETLIEFIISKMNELEIERISENCFYLVTDQIYHYEFVIGDTEVKKICNHLMLGEDEEYISFSDCAGYFC